MIELGDRVRIVISPALIDMQLIPLASRWGSVVKVERNGRNPGAWVRLDRRFKDLYCWFIPMKSIRTPLNENTIDRKKRKELINTINL